MLKIIRLYLNNPLENYNYIIVDQDLNQAVLIDPLDVDLVWERISKDKLDVKAIFITHEHSDHYRGAKPLAELTKAPIYAHNSNKDNLPQVDYTVVEGDQIKLTDSLQFEVLETPGHIKGHISFFMAETSDGIPRLICGDTLFNAGVGNCRHSSASVESLYQSVLKIRQLPKETLIYPGHDYIGKNLQFSLSVDPDNQKAKTLLEKVTVQTPETRQMTNLEMESEINPFFRLNQIPAYQNLEPLEVFRQLRHLRDQF